MTIEYQIIKQGSIDELMALYIGANWWHNTKGEKEKIPLIVLNSFCFVVAKNELGKIIGMGRAISDGVSDAYIQDVTVLKEFRGNGIGSKIINTITNFCLKNGIDWIGLVAEPGTFDFYETLGFESLQNYQPMIYKMSFINDTK